MFQYKRWILPTVPHGITDIVDSPKKTLFVYSTLAPTIMHLNDDVKKVGLMICSIYHMRKDVPFGILGSVCMHNIWLSRPEIAVLFLSFIHTPRHYLRTLKINKKKKIISIVSFTCCMFLGLSHGFDLKMIEYFGNYWWISPAICHIIIHEFK